MGDNYLTYLFEELFYIITKICHYVLHSSV